MANYDDHGLTIDDLDIGVSGAGVQNYIEGLRVEILTNVSDKIKENYKNVEAVLNQAWQGVSRNNFDVRVKTMQDNIITDLEQEFNDVVARLEELTQNYIEQDRNMISVE